MTKLLPSKKANNASSYRTLCKRASRLPDDLSENFIVREPETICDDRRRSAVVFFATQRLANTRLYFLESITFNVLQLNWSSRHPGVCVRVCARVNVCAYRSFKFQRIVENFVSAFKSNKEIVVF